jgi:peptidoglycan/xylan/chitin deacetylase (PgdA/CDA1 family)
VIPILLYHSVDVSSSEAYRRWSIHPSLFAEHLDVITGLGHDCLTVSEYIDRRAVGTLPDRPLLVTFDDGRADFSEHAVPILASRKIPSTMYVVSGHIGATSSWLPIPDERDRPMMSWTELRSLSEAGVEIGAHSLTHPELDVIGNKRARQEIAESRDHLEAGLARPVRSFAYPHGYHSRAVVGIVADSGYDSACAVKHRWSHLGDDAFALSRLIIDGWMSSEALERMLVSPPTRQPRERRTLQLGWRCARRARSTLRRRP